MVENFDDEFQDSEIKPSPGGLAHWLEEQYSGDDRFEAVEVEDPGPLEGEAVRVKFICSTSAHFFVAVLEDESVVRVGLATADLAVSEAIEGAANENGDTLTEFLEEAMGAEDELENEVRHFHDDVYYFCSDISYQREEDLSSDILRDEVIYYLDGYMTGLIDYVAEAEEE
jgi:hypothetical protein